MNGVLISGVIIWIVIIGILYFIGSFVIDKIAERQCWLESSKNLAYVILWLLICVFTGTLLIFSLVILIYFINFILVYKRENNLLFIIENPNYFKILLDLNRLGFNGIGNLAECLNLNFKGNDYKILQAIINNYKCRGLINTNDFIELQPGTILKLTDGTKWNKNFCNK